MKLYSVRTVENGVDREYLVKAEAACWVMEVIEEGENIKGEIQSITLVEE